MKNKKATIKAKIKGIIQDEILGLHSKRDLIDEELQVLVKMMGFVDDKKPHRASAKRFVRRPTSEVALEMLAKQDEVTPAQLAEKARVSGAAASQCLAVLAENKKAKRVKRGVFSR